MYEHWYARRSAAGNRGLSPRLKFETGQDTDDADPYVCFRRRELRQIRKTRNRDAQSAEKLRKMRKELEDARQLLAMVKQREMIRKEVLNIDRTLFQQRVEVKETKRKLGIKGDDEDLVNQKVVTLHPPLMMKTDLNLAQEADHRAEPWPTSLAATITASAQPWRTWRRSAFAGRRASRQTKGNRARDRAECPEAYSLERGIC